MLRCLRTPSRFSTSLGCLVCQMVTHKNTCFPGVVVRTERNVCARCVSWIAPGGWETLTSPGLKELLEQGWGGGGLSEEGPHSVAEPECGGSSSAESCLCLPQKEASLGAALAGGRGPEEPQAGDSPRFLWRWGCRHPLPQGLLLLSLGGSCSLPGWSFLGQ